MIRLLPFVSRNVNTHHLNPVMTLNLKFEIQYGKLVSFQKFLFEKTIQNKIKSNTNVIIIVWPCLKCAITRGFWINKDKSSRILGIPRRLGLDSKPVFKIMNKCYVHDNSMSLNNYWFMLRLKFIYIVSLVKDQDPQNEWMNK